MEGNKIPRRYRNPFLAQAMAELNMIDTMGYGIHEMHLGRRGATSRCPITT
jgi:ATP-dependent DNA helicase RecG